MQEKSHAFGGDFFYIETQTCSVTIDITNNLKKLFIITIRQFREIVFIICADKTRNIEEGMGNEKEKMGFRI